MTGEPLRNLPLTELLREWSAGESDAFSEFAPLVLRELRRLAGIQMRGERKNHTLQPTSLVNELFLRLMRRDKVSWKNRRHFFGTAAQLMRRILVDHARAKDTVKRGGEKQIVPLLPDAVATEPDSSVDLVLLDDALTRLQYLDPELATLVELRFFAGLTLPEVADVLNVSPSTVSRSWATARAWLRSELESKSP